MTQNQPTSTTNKCGKTMVRQRTRVSKLNKTGKVRSMIVCNNIKMKTRNRKMRQNMSKVSIKTDWSAFWGKFGRNFGILKKYWKYLENFNKFTITCSYIILYLTEVINDLINELHWTGGLSLIPMVLTPSTPRPLSMSLWIYRTYKVRNSFKNKDFSTEFSTNIVKQ